MKRTAKTAFGLAMLLGLGALGSPALGDDHPGPSMRERVQKLSEALSGTAVGGVSTEASVRSPWAAFDTQNDPKNSDGSNRSVNYGEGDITSYGVVHRGNIALSVRSRVGTNPMSGAPWKFGLTGIAWGIDIHTDGKIDFLVAFGNDGFGNIAGEVVVNNASFTHRCYATPEWYGGNGFRVIFNRACINKPNYFRITTVFLYDRYYYDLSKPVSMDFAPNRPPSNTITLTPYIFPG
jgi:hypothetical protein